MSTHTVVVTLPGGVTVEVTVSGPDAERVLAKEVTRHGDE